MQAKLPLDKEPGPPPGSLWPTWHYNNYLKHNAGGRLLYRMPFDELFWREAKKREEVSSWNVDKSTPRHKAMAPTLVPEKIQGFIVAFPVNWTFREKNQSGMNLTVLAENDLEQDPASSQKHARADGHPPMEAPV